jgi:protein arginine N-methyltransferase 3
MAECRTIVGQQFDAGRLAEIVNEQGPLPAAGPTKRDDDSHYFSSYRENGA